MINAWGNSWGTNWANSWSTVSTSPSGTCVDAWGTTWNGTWGESWCSNVAVVTPVVTGGGGGGKIYRYFTPLSGRKKKRIDEIIAKEARLVKQFSIYQDTGADADLINDLLLQLRQLQLLILQFALESESAQNYIAQQREQEEMDDIKFILTVI